MGIFDRQAKLAQDRAAKRDFGGALEAIDRAVEEGIKALVFRARLLDAIGRPTDALNTLRCIDCGLGPRREYLEIQADLELRLDLFEDGLITLNRLLDLAGLPAGDRARLLARRADTYRVLGDFDLSVADFDAAIALRPGEGEYHRLRGDLVTIDPDDGALERLQKARAAAQPGSRAAVHLDFALAKAKDDLGDHAGAAAAFTRANDLMRKRHPYDIGQRLSLVEAACTAFAGVTPATVSVPGASDFAPIFITGLPRSGTTLIEQILSAHPDVSGAGETGLFSATAEAIVGNPVAPPSDGLDLSSDSLSRLGHAYADRMVTQFGPAARHSDKSLQTLLVAGPALTALPRAQLVVVRRDPRAVALSLYRQVFRDGKQLFSYDLDDILAYQKSFDRLVAFWSVRLPDRFHIVDYEDVVTGPDRAIRALLDRVNLPFDAACLAPQDSRRPVKTLSAVAVRKPITADALRSWLPYETLLGLDRFAP